MALLAGRSADNSSELTDPQQAVSRAGRLLARKIWLPRFLYAILPWFYVGSGLLALLATVYISDWYWILPHYLLFSAGCLHLGVAVRRRRRRARS
jgi:hypothetical protein